MVKHFSSNIYEAKRDGFRDAIPQAAMAGASYCRQHKYVGYLLKDRIVDDLRSLSMFRSCVTNGEIWVFFIFNVADSGEGGTVSISDEFRLGDDLSGLPLVLGLLGDWVSINRCFSSFKRPNLIPIQIMNSKKREQQFFTYFNP